MIPFNNVMTRRAVIKGSASVLGAAALTGPLGAFRARSIGPVELIRSPYGAIAPVNDQSTGLPLLQLPSGFSYKSFSWTGDVMTNGQQVPAHHDGMSVVRARNTDGQSEIVLIRNHEIRFGNLIDAPARYDTVETPDGMPGGGATQLVFRNSEWVSASPALGGTLLNCSGGRSPWGTWLTCEETVSDLTSIGGRKHGYVFEVPVDPILATGNPLVEMGRFKHEAVTIDPRTGTVYLTEDNRNRSGFYRFTPYDTNGRFGSLEQGGLLQAAKVVGEYSADLNTPLFGDEFQLEWVTIVNPDADPADFSDSTVNGRVSGPFMEARAKGAARMSRGEGCWYGGDGFVYIVDTAAGFDSSGKAGHGEGAIWCLDPVTDRIKAIFVSGNPAVGNNPDNLTVSPRGGILFCEDGGGVDDQYGFGERLMGLTDSGDTYIFAKNNIVLGPIEVMIASKSVSAGDYRGKEWAGATFDPLGRTLFVNIWDPGITFAISGPWRDGNL